MWCSWWKELFTVWRGFEHGGDVEVTIQKEQKIHNFVRQLGMGEVEWLMNCLKSIVGGNPVQSGL